MRVVVLSSIVVLSLWLETSARACVPSFPHHLWTTAEARAAEAACTRGDHTACVAAFAATGSLANAERACDVGDPRACQALADAEAPSERGLQLLAEVCLGSKACSDKSSWEYRELLTSRQHALLPPLPESVTRCASDPETSTCLAACKSADPTGCANLETVAATPAQVETARRQLEAQCRRNNARACLSVWAFSGAHPCSRDSLPPGVQARGQAALAKACKLGLHEDCHQVE